MCHFPTKESMMIANRFFISLLLSVVCVSSLLAEEPLPKNLATVEDVKIDKEELFERLVEKHGYAILENLINEKVIEVSLKKMSLPMVTEKEIDAHIALMERHLVATQGAQANIKTFLKNQNMSLSELRRKAKREIGLRRILGNTITANPKEMEEFYAQNKRYYTLPPMRRVIAVTVFHRNSPTPENMETERSEGEAQKIAEDFRDAVLKDPKHLDEVYKAGKFFIVGYDKPYGIPFKFSKEEEYKGLFAAQFGQWTDVVKDKVGYSVFKVVEDQDAKVVPFDTLKEEIEAQVISAKIGKMIQDGAFEKLKSGYKIERFVELKREE